MLGPGHPLWHVGDSSKFVARMTKINNSVSVCCTLCFDHGTFYGLWISDDDRKKQVAVIRGIFTQALGQLWFSLEHEIR